MEKIALTDCGDRSILAQVSPITKKTGWNGSLNKATFCGQIFKFLDGHLRFKTGVT